MMLILCYKEAAPQYNDPITSFSSVMAETEEIAAAAISDFFVSTGGAGRQHIFIVLDGEYSFQSLKQNHRWNEEAHSILIDTPPLVRELFDSEESYETEKVRVGQVLDTIKGLYDNKIPNTN